MFERVCVEYNQQFSMDNLKEEDQMGKCQDNIRTNLKEMKLNLTLVL